MEIWRMAEVLGVKVLPHRDWPREEGARYAISARGAFILLPHTSLREERWLIAHELGHHVQPVLIGNPTWLAEARADKWAVETLLDLYELDQVAWPRRVWHLLPYWEDLEAA